MPKVLHEETGKVYDMSSALAVKFAAKEGYSIVEGEQINIEDSLGVGRTVSSEDYDRVAASGARAESLGEQQHAEDEQRIQDEHGSLGQRIITGAEHVADTVSMGGYGLAARAFGSDEYNTNRRERTQANPGTALGADLGALAVGGLGAVGKGALGQAMRLTPYGKVVAKGHSAAKSGKVVRAMTAEGFVEGAAQELQAITLSEDPLEIERVVSQMGYGGLVGAGAGFGLGVAGKAATKGILKAKSLATKGDDVAKAGSKVISNASEEGVALVDDFRAYKETDIDLFDLHLGKDAEGKRVVNELRGGKGRFKKILDEPIGPSENPRGLLYPLRKEAKLLEEALDDVPALVAKGAAFDRKLIKELDKVAFGGPLKDDLASSYASWAGLKTKRATARKGITPPANRVHAFREAIEAGELAAKRQGDINRLPELLAQNRDMQQRTLDIMEAAKGQKDGFLKTAALGSAMAAGTGAASAVLPDQMGFMAPMIGAGVASKMNGLLFGRMAKASAAAAKRTDAAIEKFIKAGTAARRLSVPAATKVLSQASFGEADPERGPKAKPRDTQDKLYTAYKAREKELYGQVQMGPNGIMLRPTARKEIFDNLAGVRAVSPQLADNIESQQAKKIEFLAGKLPKRPDSAAMRLGPDTWRPSDMAIRELARYVAAIEDPQGVFERVADATVTPEDGETIREVYPEQFRDFQERVIAELPKLREQLDYQKRLALSIFTGVPVDAAMDPRVLSLLQGNFAEENGAGNQAPKASPQFGSVSKPEPTPGQKRAS